MSTDSTLHFELRFEERDDCLYAFVTGSGDSLDVSTEYLTQIHREVERLGVSKLLIEEDFLNRLTSMHTYEITRLVFGLFGKRTKIAYVDGNLEDMTLNSFREDLCCNLGMDLRMFFKVEDAEAWLST